MNFNIMGQDGMSKMEQPHATSEHYGIAKITDSRTVTEADNGLVMGAWENNAGRAGSLRNKIEMLETIQQQSCILKSSGPSWMCNGIANLNEVDGVRIHLLNNGMHIVSGVFAITDVNAFTDAMNSGGHLMQFPPEYAFINNFSDAQIWSGMAISVDTARAFPVRIPSGGSSLFMWGSSTVSLMEKTAYQLFAIY